MRKIDPQAISLAFCLALVPSIPQADQLGWLDAASQAPELSLPDLRDRTHDLTDYRGRVLVVNFWASWCPPCIVEMPGLQRLASRLATRPFALLAVNVGDPEYRVRRVLKLAGFEQTVLLDIGSETYERWGASAFPTSYLIDKAGRIRFEAVGPLDWEGDDVLDAIEALMSEELGTEAGALPVRGAYRRTRLTPAVASPTADRTPSMP